MLRQSLKSLSVDPARLAAARTFIVDPIDGTRAFIDGQEGFSVSVAVVEDGRGRLTVGTAR